MLATLSPNFAAINSPSTKTHPGSASASVSVSASSASTPPTGLVLSPLHHQHSNASSSGSDPTNRARTAAPFSNLFRSHQTPPQQQVGARLVALQQERKRRASCELNAGPLVALTPHVSCEDGPDSSSASLRVSTTTTPVKKLEEEHRFPSSSSSSSPATTSPGTFSTPLPSSGFNVLVVGSIPSALSDSPKRRKIEIFSDGNVGPLEVDNINNNNDNLGGASCLPSCSQPSLLIHHHQHGEAKMAEDNMRSASSTSYTGADTHDGQAPFAESSSQATAPLTGDTIPPTSEDAFASMQPFSVAGASTSLPNSGGSGGVVAGSTRKARPKRLNLVPPPGSSFHSTRSKLGGLVNGNGAGGDGKDGGEDWRADSKMGSSGTGTRSVPVSPSLVLSSVHSGAGGAVGPGGGSGAAGAGLGLGAIGAGVGSSELGVDPVKDLSSTLRGALRRRPSVPFRTNVGSGAVGPAGTVASTTGGVTGSNNGGHLGAGQSPRRAGAPSLSIRTDPKVLGSSTQAEGSGPKTAGGNEGLRALGLANAATSSSSTTEVTPRTLIARVPEAFRDPSEHILSGKGSTLQHARSVYAAGPIEILPGLFLGDEHNARDAGRLSELNITTILDVAKETSLPGGGEEEETLVENGMGGGFATLAIPVRTPRQLPSSSSSQQAASAVTPVGLHSAYRPYGFPETFPLSGSSMPATTPVTAYFTPPTTAYPRELPDEVPGTPASKNAPPPVVSDGEKTPYLRNTLSTPNLQRYGSTGRGVTGKETSASGQRRIRNGRRRGGRGDPTSSISSSSSSSSSSGGSDYTDALMEEEDDDDFDDEEEGATPLTSVSSKPSSPGMTPVTAGRFATGGAGGSKSGAGVADGVMDIDEPAIQAKGAEAEPGVDDNTLRLRDHRGQSVWLPSNAIALMIPPSPLSGRAKETRYIKLPWTHDEPDLAVAGGGFTQGCAIIADALGIPPRLTPSGGVRGKTRKGSVVGGMLPLSSAEFVPRAPILGSEAAAQRGEGVGGGALQQQQRQQQQRPAGVLVHCQCGVSRSATLVIAFVMQAAALMYGFEGVSSLTGMHDCYNLVKDISPNCGLIYQLVEWERFLSAEATKLREATAKASQEDMGGSGAEEGGNSSRGWTSEAMDEEEWTRMRLEEERKEAEEEDRLRKVRLEEAVQAARRKAAEEAATAGSAAESGEGLAQPGQGLGARRKKKAPALSLAGGSKLGGCASTVNASAVPTQGPVAVSTGLQTIAAAANGSAVPPTSTARSALSGTSRSRPSHLHIDPAAPLTDAMPSLSLESTKEEDHETQRLQRRVEFGDELAARLEDTQKTPTSRNSPYSNSLHASRSVPGTSMTLSRLSSIRRPEDGRDDDENEMEGSGGQVFKSASASASRPHTSDRRMSSFVGAAAQSAADRKERHRRTFSSDWPPVISRNSLASLKAEVQAAAAKATALTNAGAEGLRELHNP
ncbi:unnamed protein product [Tilletia caries]|nr:unnamed protein product [Tilletia caries]